MAVGHSSLWGQAPDLGLDLVKLGDTLEPVLSDRGGAVAGDFEEFASGVGPTIGKLDGWAGSFGLNEAVIPTALSTDFCPRA